MIRRDALLATLGVLGVALAGCRASGSATPQDGDIDGPPGGEDDVDTTITGGPMGDVPAGMQLSYTFTSNVADATFECRADAASFARCTSPHAITAAVGDHTFEVRARDAKGDADPTPASRSYKGVAGGNRVRLMAGNITSGNAQAYELPGTHIFQGLRPDIAMIQEFNVGDNSPAAVRTWVDTTFGAAFYVFRESGAQIPNGIVSRYPIVQSGIWQDTESPNREFAYARIDLPGAKDLWAISVHLLTDDTRRPAEATELVGHINANVPASDYLVIAGDFNSDTRTEAAITTLGQVVNVAAPFPVDQAGDGDTNASRGSPYDWVMFDADLNALRTAVTIGTASFPNGLVFDSRVYTPLSDVSPVVMSDSAAINMQHMGVVKDILLPAP
jgi:endonuclease/exonuclease/phosphatase family metal-dependent hydrolase